MLRQRTRRPAERNELARRDVEVEAAKDRDVRAREVAEVDVAEADRALDVGAVCALRFGSDVDQSLGIGQVDKRCGRSPRRGHV